MIMVDTSVWVDYLAGHPTREAVLLRDQLLYNQRIVVGDLILCEVLQGIRNEKEFDRVRQRMLTLEVAPICDPCAAVQAARNYRSLRERGVTIRRTVDCLIATFCIEHSLPLLHNDRDFDPFEQYLGLEVLHVPER